LSFAYVRGGVGDCLIFKMMDLDAVAIMPVDLIDLEHQVDDEYQYSFDNRRTYKQGRYSVEGLRPKS